jgi:hypothetical protein
MRTTVDIPDAKYRLLKSRAASEGTTVKAMVMRGVDVVLSEEITPRRRRLKLPLLKSKHPATLEIDNERIYDLIGFP